MQPRLAPLEAPFSPDVAEILDKMMPPGTGVPPLAIFRTLARQAKLGRRAAAVGGALFRGALPLADRELAILRATARCDAEYEWGVHVAWMAAAAGLSDVQVRATRLGDATDSAWSDRQRAIVRAVDELHDRADLTDDAWTDLGAHFDDDQRLELLVLCGFYRLISNVVNAARVAHEPWAARFPVE